MTTEHDWRDGYKRAIARYVGVPDEVALEDIVISEYSSDGYRYSSYTFEDPSITITVGWSEFGKPSQYRDIDGPDAIGRLIASFLPPDNSDELRLE